MKTAIEMLENQTKKFLQSKLDKINNLNSANDFLFSFSGIENFFNKKEELLLCKELLNIDQIICEDSSRREYGDYQTPIELTDKICSYLAKNRISPSVLIEPTFGKGSFIISGIKYFPNLESIFGIEIYEPYIWFSKFRILEFFFKDPELDKPKIEFYNEDIYEFELQKIEENSGYNSLILGNPPWITNSELGSLNSDNLPEKSNIKNLDSLDALTGKSNFDISEYIILMILDAFSKKDGYLAMLVKNTVIKNLVYLLPNCPYKISEIASYKINTNKYFNASVEASLLSCHLGSRTENYQCDVFELDLPNVVKNKFGWVDKKFVSNVNNYKKNSKYDGKSPFVWRQGLKHDCAKIMELTRKENSLFNGFKDKIEIEENLLYPLAKSSDLNQPILRETRKSVIVTQSRIGEETIEKLAKYPKLFSYLKKNKYLFEKRKSSIYKNKPPFSIFGIGDYSFKYYKVAISGLYKQSQFCLVLPPEDKPVMIDDTCYFLGFEYFPYSIFVWSMLNNYRVQNLLDNITFKDSKRTFTKEILMRIDLNALANDLDFDELLEDISEIDIELSKFVSKKSWKEFKNLINTNTPERQLTLF